MLGSLNQFIITSSTPQQSQPQEDNDIEIIHISKHSRKSQLNYRKKKNKEKGMEITHNSLLQNYTRNFNFFDNRRGESAGRGSTESIPKRKKLCHSRLSSMFHGDNHIKIGNDTSIQNLKRQHNLLRAMNKAKIEAQSKIKPSHYEESFHRVVAEMGKIHIKAQRIHTSQPKQEKPQSKRNFSTGKTDKCKSLLSNRQRVQLHNCLKWSKVHGKDGSFYKNKLKKKMEKVDSIEGLQTRQDLLKSLHRRAYSVGLEYS